MKSLVGRKKKHINKVYNCFRDQFLLAEALYIVVPRDACEVGRQIMRWQLFVSTVQPPEHVLTNKLGIL